MATNAKRRDSATTSGQRPPATTHQKKTRVASDGSRNGRIRWLSREEGRKYFEREVRKRLGIGADEYLRRLDAGEYRDVPDDPEHWPIIELSLMTAFAR